MVFFLYLSITVHGLTSRGLSTSRVLPSINLVLYHATSMATHMPTVGSLSFSMAMWAIGS